MASSFKKVLIFLVLMTAVACSSSRKNEKNQAALYFGAGTQSLMSQQYTEALTNLLKANQLDPDNSEILTNLAMAYYFKGEKETAIRYLKRSVELDGSNSDAKVNLASIHYHDGNIAKAEQTYKEVLRDLTYDKQARTFYNLGVLELEKKNNSVAAENYFRKSLKEDDNYCPSYYQIGLMQFKRKQFHLALKSFKDATLGTCNESAISHYYQALTLTELKRFSEARMKYDEIDSRFRNSDYAEKARKKLIELNFVEKNTLNMDEGHASRKLLESPDF
jgi:Tfp pilus assembly protein PilF